jgi:hypothetical protein
LKALLEGCDACIPDAQDFNGPIAVAGIEAALAVCHSVACCSSGDPKEAGLSAQNALNLCYWYTEFSFERIHNRVDWARHAQELKYARHDNPYFRPEYDRQQAILGKLQRLPRLSKAFLVSLRREAKEAKLQAMYPDLGAPAGG